MIARGLDRHYSRSFFSGVLAGATLGALVRHVLQAFVGFPLVLSALSGVGIAIALFRCRQLAPSVGALLTGFALSYALPATLAPPSSTVMTRALPLLHGVDLFDALAKLDDDSAAFGGKRISVSGLWRPADSSGPAAVYRVVMTCCAADAVEAGFDVQPIGRVRIPPGTAVRVSGIPTMVMRSGDTRFELRDARVAASPENSFSR